MERIPSWVFWMFVVIFAALGIWSFTAEFWIGVFVSAVFAACFVALVVVRGSRTTAV